jgi:glutamate/aspartate transport system substrate-binding protein
MWGVRFMRCAVLALVGAALAGSCATAEPIDGRLKLVQETAAVRIAYRTDSRPFSFLDTPGRPTGYTIELCERIVKALERQLGKALGIKWVAVDTRTRFDTIVNGEVDMECGSTTVSLSRLKLVDFSSFVFAESTGVLVRSDKGLIQFDDMAGRRIGIIPGSTNAQAIRTQLDRRKLSATLVEFRDRDAGVAALARGDIEGFATDKVVLLAMAQALGPRDFTMLPEDLSFEPFAIMLPRGDWAFRLAVNTALAQIFRSGDVLDLYSKYFSAFAARPSLFLGAVFTFGALPE